MITGVMMLCPLCQNELPDSATQCTRCDWVLAPPEPPSHKKDWISAVLSFVPGLGHLYKGHLVPGLLLLCVLGPLYLGVVFGLIPKTYGLSLILPAFFVFAVGYRAYHLPDVRTDPGVNEQAGVTIRRWLNWLRVARKEIKPD